MLSDHIQPNILQGNTQPPIDELRAELWHRRHNLAKAVSDPPVYPFLTDIHRQLSLYRQLSHDEIRHGDFAICQGPMHAA